MLAAEAWQKVGSFPPPIADVFSQAPEPFASLVPLIILPEHKVCLDTDNAPSQNDVWALASHAFGLASITVEAKVSEPFDQTVAAWRADESTGKKTRLAFLLRILGIESIPSAQIDDVRYQLLHRLASAVIEAERFHARLAICVIQSFSKSLEGFSDFEAFARLFGANPLPGQIVRLGKHNGVTFFGV